MKEELINYLVINSGKPDNKTWEEVGKEFGVNGETARGTWYRYRQKNSVPENGTVSKVKTWQTYSGEVRTSITYRVEQQVEDIKKIREDFIADAKEHSPDYKTKEYPAHNDEKLVEICVPDLHFGKLSNHEEAEAYYSTETAALLMISAVQNLKAMTSGFNVEKFLLPVGNDLFNSEGSRHTTTPSSRNGYNGTPQQEDNEWTKVFRIARKTIVDCIDMLLEKAPVEVIMIGGNHDASSNWYLGDSLQSWFHKNSSVKIDNDFKTRKYFRYHNNLIGYSHGDMVKLGELPLVMATERKDDWAACKYKEFHTGHIHKKAMDEKCGVRVRVIPSLCNQDKWHFDNGFIGNIRAAQAFVWDKNRGNIASFEYSV